MLDPAERGDPGVDTQAEQGPALEALDEGGSRQRMCQREHAAELTGDRYSDGMRALLLVNPKATTVSPRVQEVITRALASELDLQVAETRCRGHATTLARHAVDQGYGLLVALGGDGTVNEVANGMLTGSPHSAGHPALAVVPGGDANVFVRALGLPPTPVEATGALLEAVRAGSTRAIGLGRAEDRYFTFCAGLGLDAEVIRTVEGLRAHGHRSSTRLYVGQALRQFFTVTDRRHPALRLERPSTRPVEDIFLAVVSNASPWTFIGRHPVAPTPLASFDTGLDVTGLRSMGTAATLDQLRQFLTPNGKPPRGRHTVTVHDEAELTLVASRPIAFQLDGDYLGERERVTFRAASRALRVLVSPDSGQAPAQAGDGG